MWTQKEAIELCRRVEAVCPPTGFHVALTGGLLYKDGPREDCDLFFHRIRQRKTVNKEDLFAALDEIGLTEQKGFGWCHKARWRGKDLDLFFPEEHGGEYRPK